MLSSSSMNITSNSKKKSRFCDIFLKKNDDVLLVYLMFRMNNFTIYKIVTIFENTIVFFCNIIAF